jgi:pilus assembly protein Flp/PilA
LRLTEGAKAMLKFLRFMRNQQGATAIEYALVAGLISIAVVGSFNLVAGRTIGMWNFVSDTFSNATS